MEWLSQVLRRPPIEWVDLLDILIVAVLVYEVLVLIKSTVRRVRLFDADWESRTTRLIATAQRLFHALQEETLVRH